MKITHIYHSGFCVEMDRAVLIFDWYMGDLPEFDRSKKVFVFVSHGHEDHYNRCIWNLQRALDNVFYILDSDTAQEFKGKNILHVALNRTYSFEGVTIETYTSTDEGVAFIVKLEEKCIYHAGDLNIWCWEDTSDAEKEKSERLYRREMERLSLQNIDIAFVPLDPRLGKESVKAIEVFMDQVGCGTLFPMHYWDSVEEAKQYAAQLASKEYADRICFDTECEISLNVE